MSMIGDVIGSFAPNTVASDVKPAACLLGCVGLVVAVAGSAFGTMSSAEVAMTTLLSGVTILGGMMGSLGLLAFSLITFLGLCIATAPVVPIFATPYYYPYTPAIIWW